MGESLRANDERSELSGSQCCAESLAWSPPNRSARSVTPQKLTIARGWLCGPARSAVGARAESKARRAPAEKPTRSVPRLSAPQCAARFRTAYEERPAAVGAPVCGAVSHCLNGVPHVHGGCGRPGFRGYPIAGVRHHVSPGSENRDEPCGVGFRSTLPAAASDQNYEWRRMSWLQRCVINVQVLVRVWAVGERSEEHTSELQSL